MRAAPAAAFLLLAGPALALAQTRTPTSPLDRPAPPPTTRPASPPSAPNAPSPVTTAPRVDLRVPAAPPPGAPLEALLPPLRGPAGRGGSQERRPGDPPYTRDPPPREDPRLGPRGSEASM